MPWLTRSWGGSAVIACPSKTTSPARGRRSPEITFINVDLPAPLGPSNATTSPDATAHRAPQSTW
jgi:hypothetical protein